MIDEKAINLKEVCISDERKKLKKKLIIFYTIKDKDWADWMIKLFWKMFSGSIGSKKRLDELKKIR